MADLLLSPNSPPNAFHPWTNPPTPIPPPPTLHGCRMGLVMPMRPIAKATALKDISRGKRLDEMEDATISGLKELEAFFKQYEPENRTEPAKVVKKSNSKKVATCKATFMKKRNEMLEAGATNKPDTRISDPEAELRWYERSNTEVDVINQQETASDSTPIAEPDCSHEPGQDPVDDSTYSRVENRGRPFPRVPLWRLLLNHSGYI